MKQPVITTTLRPGLTALRTSHFVREGTYIWAIRIPDPRNGQRLITLGRVGWSQHEYQFYPEDCGVSAGEGDLRLISAFCALETIDHLARLRTS